MLLDEIKKGDRIGFFGMGLSNLSLLKRILPLGCEIIVRSDAPIDRSILEGMVKPENILEGNRSLEHIDEDILFLSPSVKRDRPQLAKAKEQGVKISSDYEIFFESVKKPVIAITGSDGKSTTSHLTNLILSRAGYRSETVGNMGRPMTDLLYKETDFYVAELSSFMLSCGAPKVHRAALTNLTPNHLDWHKDYEEYKKTKINLLKSSEKYVISEENAEIPSAFAITSQRRLEEIKSIYKAEIYFTCEDGFILRNGEKIIALDNIKSKQNHNIKNLMMAIALTDGYADNEAIVSVANSFCGLDHRCQIICNRGGVEYIDSSIDSTPSRTLATLSALGREVVLILGGGSKGLNYSQLGRAINDYARWVIICGENAEEIYSSLPDKSRAEIFTDFHSAVMRGTTLAKEVGTLLLSPASTSFDRFKSYAERGDKFKEIILNNT